MSTHAIYDKEGNLCGLNVTIESGVVEAESYHRETLAPKGPPASRFSLIAEEIGALVTEKNKAYGDSCRSSAEILKQLYPKGVLPHQYRDMLLVVRILDKLGRIANKKDAFGESPFRDIAGYGILGADFDEEKQSPEF